MLNYEKFLEGLFINLAERVELDSQFAKNEKIVNSLMYLKGIEKKKLVEINHAVFEAQMRAIEIVCREAFMCGVNFCNQQAN